MQVGQSSQHLFRDSSTNPYSHIPASVVRHKKLSMGSSPIDWTEIQPSKKWRILSKQKRFALWALYSSIGSMMLGKLKEFSRLPGFVMSANSAASFPRV